MADSLQNMIASQAREIKKLKAARNLPNTAAADMAGLLNISNVALQSTKEDLEMKNAQLIQQLSAAGAEIAKLSQRNIFVEAELLAASQLFHRTIPGEQDLKRQNSQLHAYIAQLQTDISILQHERTLRQQENCIQYQRNKVLEADRSTLLTEHEILHTTCKEWGTYSAQQAVEIQALKKQAQSLHESMVRKSWRLDVQKSYLDKAGLIVEEFATNDDLAARQWVEKVLGKNGDGVLKGAEDEAASGTSTESEGGGGTRETTEDAEEVMCAAPNGK